MPRFDQLELYETPPSTFDGDDRPVGLLYLQMAGVVVSLDRRDGRAVYVLGPFGSGWTLGALLQKV